MAKYPKGHPIFTEYKLEDLAVRLDRSVDTLFHLSRGYQRTSHQFRSMASKILNRPESDLFLPVEDPVQAD